MKADAAPTTHAPGADALMLLMERILRDVCETDPADPDHMDTVCIDVYRLRDILAHRLAQPASDAQAAEPAGWRSALLFYADKHHFDLADDSAWDTVTGEPGNFWCDEAGTATVEDGTVAAMALRGTPLPDDEEQDVQSATPSASSTGDEREAAGIERAAKWVDKRREDFDREHGSIDPETGTMEYGRGAHAEAKLEYSTELCEIADGIRALASAKDKL